MFAFQICKVLFENKKEKKALVADNWVTGTDVVSTQGVRFLRHKEHLILTYIQHSVKLQPASARNCI
jgi:hypothetical protein